MPSRRESQARSATYLPCYSWPPGEGAWGWLREFVAPSFLERFLASFSRRRSRSLLSRLSFAIVVFFLPVEAMRVRSFVVLERAV